MKRLAVIFLLIMGLMCFYSDQARAGFVSVTGPDYDGASYTFDVELDAPTVNEAFLCITWNEDASDTTPPFPAANVNLCEPLNGDPYALHYSCSIPGPILNSFVFDVFDPANGVPPLLVPGCDSITYLNLRAGLLETDAYNLGITYQETGPTAINLQSISGYSTTSIPIVFIISFMVLALGGLLLNRRR